MPETTSQYYPEEFYAAVIDNFPEAEIQSLHKELASLGEKDWKEWLLIHHDDVLFFLDGMPNNLKQKLDYQKHGRLYLAAELYIRRGIAFLEVLDAVSPLIDGQSPHNALATAADHFDVLAISSNLPLWGLSKNSPFDES